MSGLITLGGVLLPALGFGLIYRQTRASRRRVRQGERPASHAFPAEPAAIRSESVSEPRRGGRRARVLLVDDMASNLVLVAALLRREGHYVDLADSGAEAVSMVAHTPYDVVFMDIVMPGMDGPETMRHIRALPGPEANVPIVALTAGEYPTEWGLGLAMGMNGVLTKPVRPAELLDIVAGIATASPIPAAAPVPSPAALLDLDRLAELRRGLPDGLFTSLAEQCFDDIRARLPRLHQVLAESDGPAAKSEAHALAGMAGSYGLAALEQRLRGIMRQAGAGEMEAANAAAQDLDSEFEHSATLLRALLQAQTA